jgi:hypothetical protein
MMTFRPAVDSPEAAACAVVLALASDNAIDEREFQLLEQLDAYSRLGMPPARFRALAEAELRRLQGRFTDKPWLSLADIQLVDEVVDVVRAPALRLLVCRLVAGVITADGTVSEAERLVYEHMLMRWKISRSEVTAAIRSDPVRDAALPLTG